MSGRHRCARRQPRTRQLVRSAIDENGDLEHEANEPSRTALIIARQRAAHQVLDHGSILYDPFAMKILREEEKDVLQFANEHPLARIGRLFTTARSRIAEDALSRAVKRGIRQIVISARHTAPLPLRFAECCPETGIEEMRTMGWELPRTRDGVNRRNSGKFGKRPVSGLLVPKPARHAREICGSRHGKSCRSWLWPEVGNGMGVAEYGCRQSTGTEVDYLPPKRMPEEA